jgi:hypothetical protein
MNQPIPRKDQFSRILTFSGTFLVILPILAPVIFALLFFLRSGRFHFDYLMPAELFPLVLVGGGLLLWAAIRAHSQAKMIIWSYGLAIFLLFASQALAVITGLASGETEMSSPWMVVVMSGIAGYTLMVILLVIGGFLLIRNVTSPLKMNGFEK